MIFLHYYETVLEQWISTHYRANKVMSPADLEIENIAEMFDIDLQYDSCRSFSDNEERVIFLDKRLSSVPARMIFFHELCHVLRHVGDQRNMPELFKEAQEAEADAFLLYASMPFYMIQKLNLPDSQSEAIIFLSSTFQVPLKLAKQRLEQIQRRELQGIMMAAATESQRKRNLKTLKLPEPKVYAFYDPTDEYDSPSQIIICVDEQSLLSQEKIEFNPDGPIERIDESHLINFSACKRLSYDGLNLAEDGMVNLKVNFLAFKQSTSSFIFVIQRKEIEQLLYFHGAYF